MLVALLLTSTCHPFSVDRVPLQLQIASVLMAPWLTADEVAMTSRILSSAPWNRWSGANRMTGLVLQISRAVRS